jgi:glycosyltransferase involved in cell wall biosynthesis
VVDLLRPDERNIHLPGKPPIGALRNAGCETARGEIIAHFDDDDFSAPGRLADQIGRMLAATGCSVTGYRAMRFTDGRQWWEYSGPAKYALGTSLVYRREWWLMHRFPEVMVGEDNGFVAQAAARGGLVSVPAGEMMWATIHAGNTSPRGNPTGSSWAKL